MRAVVTAVSGRRRSGGRRLSCTSWSLLVTQVTIAPMAPRSSFSGGRIASRSVKICRICPILPPLVATIRRRYFIMMTEKEKKTILDMRDAGKSYREISDALGISTSALKTFLSRNRITVAETTDAELSVRTCINCRKPLQADARRTQRFCCEKCRNDWWNHHQEQISDSKRTVYVCDVCRKQFPAYKPARFCSRACYNASRRMK